MDAARQDRWTSYTRLSGGVWGTPAEYAASRPAWTHMSARTVLPRELMTRKERAALRARMQQAPPEERTALLHRQLAILEQRATARGLSLAIPAMQPDGMLSPHDMQESGPARLNGGVRGP